MDVSSPDQPEQDGGTSSGCVTENPIPEPGPSGACTSSSRLSRGQITPKELNLKKRLEFISKIRSTERKTYTKRVGDLL